MQRYTDRTVLLTGGGSGIGRATVHRLVEEGATVLAVDLAADGLAESAATAARPEAVIAVPGDVTDPDLAPAAVATALEDLESDERGVLSFPPQKGPAQYRVLADRLSRTWRPPWRPPKEPRSSRSNARG